MCAVVSQEGETACHFAAYNGHYEIVKLLVKAGADVNIAGKVGDGVLDMPASSKLHIHTDTRAHVDRVLWGRINARMTHTLARTHERTHTQAVVEVAVAAEEMEAVSASRARMN